VISRQCAELLRDACCSPALGIVFPCRQSATVRKMVACE
jgi:hypothetical protein